jgi:hypothetical protein
MGKNSEECQGPHRAVVSMLMMFCIERMNCSNTVTPKSEGAMKYVSQDIPITFPNINSVPTTKNEIKKKFSYQIIVVIIMKRQVNYLRIA